jgi:hypothetical protein
LWHELHAGTAVAVHSTHACISCTWTDMRVPHSCRSLLVLLLQTCCMTS